MLSAPTTVRSANLVGIRVTTTMSNSFSFSIALSLSQRCLDLHGWRVRFPEASRTGPGTASSRLRKACCTVGMAVIISRSRSIPIKIWICKNNDSRVIRRGPAECVLYPGHLLRNLVFHESLHQKAARDWPYHRDLQPR